jgi:tungstate transport system substrate-binding protein
MKRSSFGRVMPAAAYRLLVLVALLPALAACGDSTSRGDLILATTTSTLDSGLLDVLLPAFQEETGWRVKPIGVGSGQAMTMGRRGDADLLLVHSPDEELQFMRDGFGKERLLVMHNYYVLVGPAADPAGAASAAGVAAALRAIAASGSIFVSRGDDSGTHAMERTLWRAAGIEPAGRWYQESGQGMGPTLLIADQKDAYTLTDRGTFLALRGNLELSLLRQGDADLLNVYHVITLNPEKHPKPNHEGAAALARFLVSGRAQEIIRTFGMDRYGEPLFSPDAGKTVQELGGQ